MVVQKWHTIFRHLYRSQLHTHALVHATPSLQRDLDTLTFSGSTINDLELQLSQTRVLYRRTVVESKQKLEGMRRKLHTHLQKSQPFVEIWKKAREVGHTPCTHQMFPPEVGDMVPQLWIPLIPYLQY